MDNKLILKKRAEELAKATPLLVKDAKNLEMLVFELGEERYGIEAKYIKEVISIKEITPLPCTPSYVKGLINFRRKILTLIDLRVIFELPDISDEKNKSAIVLEGTEGEFAFIAEKICMMQQITLNDLQPPIPSLKGIGQKLLKGITSTQIIVLDGLKLMQCEELTIKEATV